MNRIQDRDFLSPEERKIKEERLKKLFRNRVLEMKEYLHRRFMKFYYNGIFLEMQRKNEGAQDNKKIVKSKRFSNLINKFNQGNNNANNNTSNKGLNRLNRNKTTKPTQEEINVLKKRITMVESSINNI